MLINMLMSFIQKQLVCGGFVVILLVRITPAMWTQNWKYTLHYFIFPHPSSVVDHVRDFHLFL